MVFITVFIIICTTLFLWSAPWLFYRRLPPGPRPWPIVGNLFLFRKGDFAAQAEKYVGKYGPIYTLWFGPRPFVVISGAELMHDSLIYQADAFLSRCDLYTTRKLSCNFQTVNTSIGPLWRTLRRNLISEVLHSSRVKSYKPVRDREIRILVDRFRDEARVNDGVIPVLTQVRRTLFNVLNTMCLGERMEENVVREIDGLMEERFRRFRGSLANFFPILRYFEWRTVQDLNAIMHRTEELMMPYLVKAREAMRKGESYSGRYLETLLGLQKAMGRDRFSDKNIFSLCAEVLNAGTDTTSHSTEWVFARIVSDAEVQRKLVEEMETVLGDKPIEESDIERLPYLQAVVRETQRLDGSTFALPHAVSEPGVKVAGYEIPVNAVVMFMINSVGLDPKIWGDPQNFRPERFLNEVPSVDLTGTKKMMLIPFGAGKRMCPAISMALMEMHMIVGTVVQTFELINGRPGKVDFASVKTPQVVQMKVPLKVRIRERKRSSLNTAVTTE